MVRDAIQMTDGNVDRHAKLEHNKFESVIGH